MTGNKLADFGDNYDQNGFANGFVRGGVDPIR
eukprot:CAMPEP_0114575778 /NCGR_PEP_ID=MMETSP0125-20121206/607_1 /TAXON_ID=485358 ORGANISM="Aristerostoma sp., Strain ATCC 50986" /NCGR_SAMPLE_ID=MMETSP0125 /ASSEMBLY_ACC=CAM_ASM_000245 /LENGTH=31 /DNA_ID= /DNA_START= /DNA_END= /DNA_ORIENTATION=